jgi:hypothetical protein
MDWGTLGFFNMDWGTLGFLLLLMAAVGAMAQRSESVRKYEYLLIIKTRFEELNHLIPQPAFRVHLERVLDAEEIEYLLSLPADLRIKHLVSRLDLKRIKYLLSKIHTKS